ncbi:MULTISPECIES: hypothetical protein [Actinomadura]|uniref:DNA-binding phage zinc finger domain-containing protein n=1 Tax=Actinomadura yumaensis TaxID=111807 RepID=A0ABW2CRJ4_9ACTN|nr:hypothetical protein [Actinomadura sp. J1-007]MWK35225.1 hypothetical protein [Actinomadura sp. J1-007]
MLWVLGAWGAMRWGELIGLEQSFYRDPKVFVEWQLAEYDDGRFRREGPKDDSYRIDEPGFFGAVEMPPGLAALMREQISRRPPRACSCEDGRCGGEGRFVFLGPKGGHPRRGNYSRRYWRPACDGVYPQEDGRRSRPARPVLVDMAAGWPGVPLTPAWPFATGPQWSPPRGPGMTRHDSAQQQALKVPCPDCEQARGRPCVSGTGKAVPTHRARITAALDGPGVALASWLPIKPGLTPHGLRHSHKVWMDEDGMPEILKHDRMGQVMPGIGGVYSHVSPAMRADLVDALQRRWENALAARAALCPRSPVRLLDELLAPQRETTSKVVSRTSPKRRSSAAAVG